MRNLVLSLGCIIWLNSFAQAKEWRGIKPLHSNRVDVEKLLGSPVADPLTGACRCLFKLEDMIVDVLYASGSCRDVANPDSSVGGWKVPRDTVVSITVRFKRERPLFLFEINDKFKRETDEHQPYLVTFVNREDGIEIAGSKDWVHSVTYFPSAKDASLKCSSDR